MKQVTMQSLAQEIAELKAEIAQMGPVALKTTTVEEIAAVMAQGLDIGEYFKNKRKVKK